MHAPVRRVVVAAVLALVVGSLLVACSDDDDGATVDADSTTTTVAATTVTQGGSGSGGGGQSSGQSGGQSGGTQAPSGPTPVINSFETPDSIDCHNDNFQMFTASWTTTNATKTTISIDGQGVYKTYGANDEASLPFNCSSSHTFLLTAYGSGGKTATRSVTLQPRNVQGTDTTEEEEP
jgi:hypothetical protein